MEYRHNPVMLEEVINLLDPRPGGFYLDCTLGGGGYTQAISERISPDGFVAAIDADPLAIANAREKFKNKNKNIILINDNFKNLEKIAAGLPPYFREKGKNLSAGFADKIQPDEKNSAGAVKFDGIVFDLGLSSAQLEDRSRGFSFQLAESPLEMGFGSGLSTVEIVNRWPAGKIESILREYGEERFAGRITRNITEARREQRIETVGDLLDIIRRAVPSFYARNKKLHFATRTFQALRIATNEELDNLKTALGQAIELLKLGGRVAVVSYHSLEDRIVKRFFKYESLDCVCPPEIFTCQCGHRSKIKIITKKALAPSAEEIRINPRSRSAKLRAAEKK